MTDKLLNVIFFDGQREYELSEIENKPYFKQCYNAISVQIKPLIETINNSKTYVYIDTSVDKENMFKIKNISKEVKDKAFEFKIDLT